MKTNTARGLRRLADQLDDWLYENRPDKQGAVSIREVVNVRDALDLLANQAEARDTALPAPEPYPGAIERLWQLWRERRSTTKREAQR